MELRQLRGNHPPSQAESKPGKLVVDDPLGIG
jgi:hypothetical protein